MRITMNHIVPLVAAGAAAVAIAAAPTAAATTGTAGSSVQQTPGNVQIVASQGALRRRRKCHRTGHSNHPVMGLAVDASTMRAGCG